MRRGMWVQRCSRWHVGGWGWRRRESLCGQPWLIAAQQQCPFHRRNDLSVYQQAGSSVVPFLQYMKRAPTHRSKQQQQQQSSLKRLANFGRTPTPSLLIRVWVDLCNKNKMSLDNSGFRAVNIQLIRLGFISKKLHQGMRQRGAARKKCTVRVININ